MTPSGSRVHALVQLVEVLRYKPEGRGFDSVRYHGHNPSGRTMTLRSIQPLTGKSTSNISWREKVAGAQG